MEFACVFFGILFIASGVWFASGRGHIHLSAWKNMPQAEKERIRIQPLCRNIGEVIALNGMIFLARGVWPGFQQHWFLIAMAAWMVIAGMDVWYIAKSGRYDCK